MGSVAKIYNNISKNVTCSFGSKVSDSQLLLLKKFKKVVVIPDDDEAGLMCIIRLNENLNNIYVKNIFVEDTNDDYINEILHSKEIKSSRSLVRKIFGGEKEGF